LEIKKVEKVYTPPEEVAHMFVWQWSEEYLNDASSQEVFLQVWPHAFLVSLNVRCCSPTNGYCAHPLPSQDLGAATVRLNAAQCAGLGSAGVVLRSS